MKGFLSFILKHHFTLLFILLQFISFVLIVSYNHTQKEAFINSSSYTAGILNSEITSVSSYFSLLEENKRLIKENTNLRNQFLKDYKKIHIPTKEIWDSLYIQTYKVLSGKVIQSSVFKTRNYITLNIGRLQGVKKGSGVICDDGVVGIVKNTTENYSVVLPVINTDFKVSCRISGNDYYGSLRWDTKSYTTAVLEDIPFHVSVEKGDSLFTTGFSSIFPSGELIGFVDNVEKIPGDNFYKIAVKLSVDFKQIRTVYVINQLLKTELDSLKVGIND